MSIKIVTDSSSNLAQEKNGAFACVPLKVIVGEREFTDNEQVDLRQMEQALRDHPGKSHTSCPSVGDWLAAFGDAEEVLCITLASTISGSCSSARAAKQEYEAEHPGRRVYVVDSLSAGPQIALMVEYAQELVESGMSAGDVYQALHHYQGRTHLVFALSKLQNFANNGRIAKLAAKGLGVMGIGIVGKVSAQGGIQLLDKCRGRKQTDSALLKQIRALGYAGGRIVISHTGNESGALELMHRLREAFGAIDVRISENRALCSYYAEEGALLVGMEC
jgi:DegV family protein with EDD domain